MDDLLLTVLYTCSDVSFCAGYNEISVQWPKVRFVKENKFKESLIGLLKSSLSGRIFFLVDDIIFTHPFVLSDFNRFSLDQYVPSLRLGRNITYSLLRRKELILPEISELNGLIFWKWNKKNSYWSYPLSVDGHIFDKNELIFMMSSLEFQAPNSLELGLQLFLPTFRKRKGLAYPHSVMVNIPWNMVQKEIDNFHGNITAEYLLGVWNNGLKIDISSFHLCNNQSGHQEFELEITQRT
jgi:hypothetical protein